MSEIKYSIIIPVYNRENFLKETIDSVLYQKKGIYSMEIILVDDGSTDHSPRICDEYKMKYPDVIKAIHKKNDGASAARITGLQNATGDFVIFLDSDDKFSRNVLSKVTAFIKKYKDQTDVISLPIYYFDERKGQHLLNYKFRNGTRVINLEEEWDAIQMSLNNVFIRREVALENAFEQNVHIATGEDAREVLRCLAPKLTMGVVKGARYYYRIHNQFSLLETAVDKKERYIENLQLFHIFIEEWYEKNKGYIPKSIQYALMYDIQWRLRQKTIPEDVLSLEKQKEYRNLLYRILTKIDDEVILKQKNIYKVEQTFSLYHKYEKLPFIKKNEEGMECFSYSNADIYGIPVESTPIRLSFLQIDDDHIKLEGNVFHYLYMTENIGDYSVMVNDEEYPLDIKRDSNDICSVGEIVCNRYHFQVEFPFGKNRITKMSFYYTYKDTKYSLTNLVYEKFFPMDEKSEQSFYHKNGLLIYKKAQYLILKKRALPCIGRELIYLLSIYIQNRRGNRKAILVHLAYHFFKLFIHYPIWIVMDRLDKADDNGEVFFEYLQSIKNKKAKVYFAVSKDSPDYERLKTIGPVLDPNSGIYKLVYLFAEYFISSQADDGIINPFHGYRSAYKCLNMPKFVFLQHGITMNDLSSWLNRSNKNIYGFITSVDEESDFIEKYFDYSREHIWQTGFPRFDKLADKKEKIITIVPTWRKELQFKKKREDIKEHFVNSGYFQFYNALINDPRILEALEQYGYQLHFKLHPMMVEYEDVFKVTKNVKMLSPHESYREMYARSAMMITDYSSTVFDFAYMKKPVIYAQFDEEQFFSGSHTLKRGYFDYRENGFGEVETDYDQIVNCIIEYIKNDCIMKQFYTDRVDKFFGFHDRECCKRVYEKLISKDIK